MQENINIEELEKSLLNIKNLTERMSKNLLNTNQLIRDSINNGSGVWDGEAAGLYRSRWESIMSDFPDVIQTFQKQEANLETFIENMKKVEE
ncbi:MAG: hypothetical protein IKQ06_00215 [Bacilli bacterium]|nr:hypothetical protein [Bacilli bacterium]